MARRKNTTSPRRVWRFFRIDTNVPQPYVSIGEQLLLNPLAPERKNKNGIPDIKGKPLDNIMNCAAIPSQNGKTMNNCNERIISSHGKENMNCEGNPDKGQRPAFIQGGEQRRRMIYGGLCPRGLQPYQIWDDSGSRKMIVSLRRLIVGDADIRCPASLKMKLNHVGIIKT